MTNNNSNKILEFVKLDFKRAGQKFDERLIKTITDDEVTIATYEYSITCNANYVWNYSDFSMYIHDWNDSVDRHLKKLEIKEKLKKFLG